MSVTAAQVVQRLRERAATVATAESLTAGLVCAGLADVPGASAVLRGGLITYATELKTVLLGVPASLIAKHGVVSGPCAEAMARGARERTGATYAVATTGVAGPDALEGHPAGTVHLGWASPTGQGSREVLLAGSRAEVRAEAVLAAWGLLLEALEGHPAAAPRPERGGSGPEQPRSV